MTVPITVAKPLAGFTVGVLAPRRGDTLCAALARRGARVVRAGTRDGAALDRFVKVLVACDLEAVVVTSGAVATTLLRAAARSRTDLRPVLCGRVLCACVGPAAAAPLEAAGIPVVRPARARRGVLVRDLVQRLPAGATVLTAAGHRLEVRGTAVLVDDTFIALPRTSMALLRSLIAGDGRVLSRDALLARLPGDSRDGHAVEAAIGRLRAALGDPDIIKTVVKRGYRLHTA